MKPTTAMLACMAFLLPMGAMAQTMYKCVQDGRTVYQAEPCPASAKQDTIKPHGGGPAYGPGGGGDVDKTIEFMSTYRACADGVQVWGQEMAAPYEEWRARNLAVVSRIESDEQLKARYLERVAAKRNGKAGMCRDVALELRGKK